MHNVLYKSHDDDVQCLLCPNLCILKDGKFGICKTRKREGDKIVNPYSGFISSSGLDPIEKKPLYHYLPATEIISIGFYGCTLSCQFCQNFSISQYKPEKNLDDMKRLDPYDIIELLQERNLKSIAFTYSEPTLHQEWVKETSILCREYNIKTVLVTNGYINKKPAEDLLQYIDAANIDLKSSRDDFYKKICHGKVEPVKQFIKLAHDMKVHIELTTLVITDTNDSISEMKEITGFIQKISSDIPFHISRYHPAYNFDKPATPIDRLEELIAIAKDGLHFVYGGNMPGDSNTYCKKCKALLISRNYYKTKIQQVDNSGRCKNCGEFNYIYI